MKIAISNLAWNFEQDEEVLPLLSKYKVKGLEIAPTKIFPNLWEEATPKNIENYKNNILSKNINIIAFQALLFGHPELQIFENKITRGNTLDYLKKIILLGEAFGAQNLVLGSPKNRDIHNLSSQAAFSMAVGFFSELGNFASQHNTRLCIEPNPKEYNCNFINTSQEGACLVRVVDSLGFRLHLDSGAMHMNQEDPEQVISENIDIVSHFHVSNPNLKEFLETPVNHQFLGQILKRNNYQQWVSIEMLPNENQIDGIKTALNMTQKYYG